VLYGTALPQVPGQAVKVKKAFGKSLGKALLTRDESAVQSEVRSDCGCELSKSNEQIHPVRCAAHCALKVGLAV
jgi:hypothetical protein